MTVSSFSNSLSTRGSIADQERAKIRISEIPSEVYEEVLQRIEKYKGGVLPPSILVRSSSPEVTMAALAEREGNQPR